MSPELGHWLLADKARDAGQVIAERTAWQIMSENIWWSVFGKNMVPQQEEARPCGP